MKVIQPSHTDHFCTVPKYDPVFCQSNVGSIISDGKLYRETKGSVLKKLSHNAISAYK